MHEIETVADRLHDLIASNGVVSLPRAAAVLELTENQTEKLALLLERADLIKVKYFFFKPTLLKSNGGNGNGRALPEKPARRRPRPRELVGDAARIGVKRLKSVFNPWWLDETK